MRRRSRRNNDEEVGDLIDRYLKAIDKSGKYLESKITNAWRSFNPAFEQYTRNVYFRQGVLHVSISSAPLKSELSMNKQKLIQNLKETLKDDLIHDILFY
jgi:hypothetical protein